jgi:single-stranded-DNA-specific exonuclease
VGIDKKQLTKAIKRIEKAIEEKEQIVVFGDYDVDGICGAAILWETLFALNPNTMPYIPHRVDEGYGLSSKGISNVQLQIPGVKLIITVDNGIVANEAVEFANSHEIDVIITDHHLPHEDAGHVLPDAYAIVHTTKLCGAGVAWLLAQKVKYQMPNVRLEKDDHLGLVALATVADMVPLTGANRTMLVYGLDILRKTKRPGLLALFDEADIEQEDMGVYQIGHAIAPRLNASGRMESAMDSLRLVCTKDANRAADLAHSIGIVNRQRQVETLSATEHALEQVKSQKLKVKSLIFVAHESYAQGVIGLVAGKLVEQYYLPAIVIAIGEKQSKASVRSIKGFNIIEFLRTKSEHFINVGGHPMAAGFTIETAKISLLQTLLVEAAEEAIDKNALIKSINIDCELPLEIVSQQLYEAIQKLSPFGIGNAEPVFVSRGAIVKDIRAIGKESKHLKLNVKCPMSNVQYDAIGFSMGDREKGIKVGDAIDIVYTIDENIWNGRRSLQLKIKDIQK